MLAIVSKSVKAKNLGFTLIEIVMGMIVFAILSGAIITIVFPQFIVSQSQVHQVRATELAHSIMSEIYSLSFDENSSQSGGFPRCGDAAAPVCTAESNYGPDTGEFTQASPTDPRILIRANADDVDDYHQQTFTGNQLTDITGNRQSLYAGFSVAVTIVPFNDSNHKQIRLAVTSPDGNQIDFASIRSNF